jgi:hypothetical protein
MTRTYNWPDREEWAKQQRTFYGDMAEDLRVSRKLADYASPEETAALTAALKALWLAQGRKLRAAKQSVGPLLRQPGESQRDHYTRIRALPEAEQRTAYQWRYVQSDRHETNEALQAATQGWLPEHQLHGDAKLILAPIQARYDAAWEAAFKQLQHQVESRSVDDAAWEKELKRRAWVEGMPRMTKVVV